MEHMRHNEISIGVPSQWFDISSIVLAGPRRGEIGPTITIARRKLIKAVSLEEFAAEQLASLRATFKPDDFVLMDEVHQQVNGLRVVKRTYRCLFMEGHVPMVQIQIYLVKGLGAYIVTGTDDEEHLGKLSDALTEAIRELRISQWSEEKTW